MISPGDEVDATLPLPLVYDPQPVPARVRSAHRGARKALLPGPVLVAIVGVTLTVASLGALVAFSQPGGGSPAPLQILSPTSAAPQAASTSAAPVAAPPPVSPPATRPVHAAASAPPPAPAHRTATTHPAATPVKHTSATPTPPTSPALTSAPPSSPARQGNHMMLDTAARYA